MNHIILEKNGLFEVEKDGSKTYFCEPIRVRTRYHDINTDKEYIDVDLVKDNTIKQLPTYCSSILADNFIREFASYGLSLNNTSYNKALLSEYLLNDAKKCKPTFVHSSLGFCNIGDTCYFLADRTYPKTKSKYFKANIGISRKGTFESWLSGLKPYIESRPELQLSLAIGAAATVNAYLQMCNIGGSSQTPLYAYIGKSSTGKTTAIKLAASVFGIPELRSGIIYSALDTDNFVYKNISGRNGFPYFIDDTAVVASKEFSQLIYQLSSGSNKHRFDTDLSSADVGSWLSSVIFTGEDSMFLQTNGNDGLYARLLEIECEWTGSAQSADAILSHITQNYGSAWQPFVKCLMLMDKKTLQETYMNYCDSIKSKLTTASNNLADRITSKLAVVLIGAHIFQHICNIEFDMNAIECLMIQSANKNTTRDIVQDAFETVKEFIVANNGNDKNIDVDFSYNYVWVSAEHFRKEFKAMTGRDFATVANKFVSNNYMRSFSDGYTSKHLLRGIKVRCYCFIVDIDKKNLCNALTAEESRRNWNRRP